MNSMQTSAGTDTTNKPIYSTWTRFKARFRKPKGVFKVAGAIACIAVYITYIQELSEGGPDPDQLTISNQAPISRLFGWLVPDPAILSSAPFATFLFLCFATALVIVTRERPVDGKIKAALVAVQLVIGLLVNNDLLLILAAQLPFIYRLNKALLWLLLQSVGMILTWGFVFFDTDFSQRIETRPDLAVSADELRFDTAVLITYSMLIFLAWQFFAFCLGYIAMSERLNRDRLTATNAQLLATQQLLAESARSGERLRIARELHDSLGHHLTALRLHLDLASRQSHGSHSEAIQTARNISDELLNEIRVTVSRERKDYPINLEQSLKTMCDGIPGLEVSLYHEPECFFSDSSQAHVAFRCIQEAVSNVMRHAEATCLSISLIRSDGGILIMVEDNGNGTKELKMGNGLQGMRERIESAGGRLEIKANHNSGFLVSFWLPNRGVGQ